MDSSWPVKCGSASSTLQSSMVMMQHQQEPQQNQQQMEKNSGQHFWSYPVHGSRLQVQTLPDPLFPSVTNFSSYPSGHADQGNSFLGLLSGPPASLLHCDFRGSLNTRLPGNPTKLVTEGSSTAPAGGIGNRVLPKSSGLVFETRSYHSVPNGADIRSIVSSTETAGSSSHSNSILQNGTQAARYSLHGSDLARAVIHGTGPSNEKVKDSFSLRGEWRNVTPANALKLQNAKAQMPDKMPLEAEATLSNNSSPSLNGWCHRVFCLATKGDLLLSHTGLLGILCSCHSFHMSVSKFCEHSGLQNVNPGDSVHMESGETIAQWRKLYFQKFGIRVPEDQSGWDWPERLSLTAGLMNSSASICKPFKNSELEHLTGPSGGLLRSRQLSDDGAFVKNLPAHQNSVDALHNEQQRIDLESSFGLVGTLQSNSCGMGENQVAACSMSRGSTMPKFVSACMDAGSFSATHPNLQTLRTLVKSSDISKTADVKGSCFVDRDAVSSSVELKLGQPCQRSQSSGNVFLSVIGPKLYNMLPESHKPFVHDGMIHKVSSCNKEEESRQYLSCGGGLFNSTGRRKEDQLESRNNAVSSVIGIGKLKNNGAKNSVPFHFEQCGTPSPGSSAYKASSKIISFSKNIVPERLPCNSHTIKSDLVNVLWSAGNGLESQQTESELGFFRSTEHGKGIGCLAGNPSNERGIGPETHKMMENRSSLAGVVDGNSYSGLPIINNNNCCQEHLFGMPPVAYSSGSIANCLEKAPHFGNSGHISDALIGSMGAPMGCRQFTPLQQAAPAGFSSSSSSIPSRTSTLSKPDSFGASPYFLDENLRLLALRQIFELSKQQHAIPSHEENLEVGKCGNSSNIRANQSLVEPSTSGGQRHRSNRPRHISEAAIKCIQYGPSSTMNDADNFTSATGLNNWCNFSTLTQGMPLQYNEMDMKCQLSHDPVHNELPALRLARSGNNTTLSNEQESYLATRYVQGDCFYVAQRKCFEGISEIGHAHASDSPGEQTRNVDKKAPIVSVSHLLKDSSASRETNSLQDPYVNSREKVSKNVNCCFSQWKDVPRNAKIHEVASVNQPADVLDGKGQEFDQVECTSAKCSNVAVDLCHPFKEQDISDISSGCATPGLTQVSVEVNNVDSSTFAAANTGSLNNPIIDEGSGIDKCWSSDDGLESDRSAEFYSSTNKMNLKEEGSEAINNQFFRSLLDEVKLMDSLTWRKGRNLVPEVALCGKTSQSQELDRKLETRKGKKELKLKTQDALLGPAGSNVRNKRADVGGTAASPCFLRSEQMGSSGEGMSYTSSDSHSVKPNCKHGMASISLGNKLSRKRELHRIYTEKDVAYDQKIELDGTAKSCKTLKIPARKKFRSTGSADKCMQYPTQEPTHAVVAKAAANNSTECLKGCSSQLVDVCSRKARPVVCGKFGEISVGDTSEGVPKTTKIVSLERVLKAAKRCTAPKNCKPKPTFPKEWNRTSSQSNDESSILEKEKDKRKKFVLICNRTNPPYVEGREGASESGEKKSAEELFMLEKGTPDKSKVDTNILSTNAPAKRKFKEIRERSLYELTLTANTPGASCKNFNSATERKVGKNLKRVQLPRKSKVKEKRQKATAVSAADSNSVCCVCGSLNEDEFNSLLECGQCLIRVHQACYGVYRVPKGHWYCRPCKTTSKNIVCVLCGYGGGAMTRALQSRTIVKSLLKAWGLKTDSGPRCEISSAENVRDELSILCPSSSIIESNSYPAQKHKNMEIQIPALAVCSVDMHKQIDNSSCCKSNLKVHNSVTDWVHDPTSKQWVHMVCGLWTPGTRCPNVDTMGAFDVSGASLPRADVVCSICNQPGGSCIQCRVVNCSVHFHPWCAHQKGLLQSEAEGVDNESIGFYGRCALHPSSPTNGSGSDAAKTEAGCSREKEASCARTEGYKGRKRDGFWHNVNGQSTAKNGCLVPQDQLNAWTHINGQKLYMNGLVKLPVSDKEYDCRKEYARYKQAKGWKHLVVYKSGIHALGMYTSRFISRGEMVVEYVGEIVGQRVADKRENEYQSGRKLQYKSACYFFRIDKEHIIDATQKGGIARFVNHSCLPNCVAKVISVRNEKKVVFLAERDIYPGEEITYDYHFNHEDEGKKIPCFCNSDNCRRYMN